MYSGFKKSQIMFLGVTAIVYSRTMFALFDDPEGPNLLIVAVGAVVIYALSLLFSRFVSHASTKKALFVIFVQAVISTILFLMMK